MDPEAKVRLSCVCRQPVESRQLKLHASNMQADMTIYCIWENHFQRPDTLFMGVRCTLGCQAVYARPRCSLRFAPFLSCDKAGMKGFPLDFGLSFLQFGRGEEFGEQARKVIISHGSSSRLTRVVAHVVSFVLFCVQQDAWPERPAAGGGMYQQQQ